MKEIFRFLRTVTIKFDPFAYIMGESYMQQHALDNPHAEWNPYYKNLIGEYSDKDTPMTVYSVEEEKHVPFTKELYTKYPKTGIFYKVGKTEYHTLEERYPKNRGLIRTIAYPVHDIKYAIEADNLTLLAYDEKYLHINERESMLKALTSFLDMVRTRWWVEEYKYENMYAHTFWLLMWQLIPAVLYGQRFLNIKTPNVHPFHIWEYLKSKGIGDYRDVLTNRQALWLYRNINYIQTNKGKNSNLRILAENLLGDVFVSLLYKDMHQDIAETWEDRVSTTPIFKSYNIVNNRHIKTESFNELNTRLIDIHMEDKEGADYVFNTELELAAQPHHRLPTKFLEFKKDPFNTSCEFIMVRVFLDNLMYRLSKNEIAFACEIRDSLSGTILKLTLQDAVLLWNYAMFRSVGAYPDKIPNKYKTHIALQTDRKHRSQIRKYIYYNNTKVGIIPLMDIDEFISRFDYSKSFGSRETWIVYCLHNYKAMLRTYFDWDASNSIYQHLATTSLLRDTHHEGWVELNLTKHENYTSWMDAIEPVKILIDSYEADNDTEKLYKKLAEACFDKIFDISLAPGEEINSVRNMEKVYVAIRNLFISLGSYNTTYLETDREQAKYLRIRDPLFAAFTKEDFSADGFFTIVHDGIDITMKVLMNLCLTQLKIDYGAHLGNITAVHPIKLKNELTISERTSTNLCTTVHEGIDINTQMYINHKATIHGSDIHTVKEK